MVLGFTAARRIPADLLPIFKTPAVQIVTLYPGMPPEVVEKDMTSRLERWTGQAVGIAGQEAISMLGVSVVKDFFREGIDPDAAMSQVTSLAVSDMFYLPPGTLPPMVMPFDPTASVPLCLLAVSSETMTEKQLYDVAYFELRNRLQSIQGVVAPAVYGGVLRRILAYVDPEKLRARGLAPMDVVRAVQSANVFVPTGSAKLGDGDWLVLTNAMVPEVEDLGDIPVRTGPEGTVFLKDVARAEDTHQIQSNIVRINGRRQVYIPIYRQPGANTLEIVDEVKAKSGQILERIREWDPAAADLRLDVVMDQSRIVRESLDSLRNSALLGAALVALVVLLFLGSLRTGMVILVALPISVMGAIAGLFFTGHTLNAMTLGGLALAVGILVDQAVVVTENVVRHLGMGKPRAQAVMDGAGEVALPILVSTLTFLVVFLPVIFLTGMAGFLFTPLAAAVAFATVISYLVAMTLIPVAGRKLFPAVAADAPTPAWIRAYEGVVAWTLRRPVSVVVAGALALALAVFGGLGLGRELFPRPDSGQLTILMRAPVGTRLERTEEMVARVENAVMTEIGRPDPAEEDSGSSLALLLSNIGVLYDWPAAYTPNTGPMDAFLLLQLKEDRDFSSEEIAARLRKVLPEAVPEADFAFDTGGILTSALNFGLPSPVDVQIQGSKLEILHEIAGAVVEEARQVPGAVDVRVGQPADYPAVRVVVDRIKAASLGLTQEDVIKNLTTALNSSVNFSPSFWIDPRNSNHYLIGAQYPKELIRDFNTLLDVPVTAKAAEASGKGGWISVPLRNLVTLERTTSPAVIKHINITRTVDVYANLDPAIPGADLGSVVRALEARLAASPRLGALMEQYESKGYRVEVRGEASEMREVFRQFGGGLGLAAILVYLILVAQFRSFRIPWVVMGAVPLGLVGVVTALGLTGTPLSIPSFMGILLMVGIVVQSSILLVDFALSRQREGIDRGQAALDAARTRLRPILMTSLTTALALVPMAIGMGRGGEANEPLARAILGAVIGGAFLTLLVVPALYTLVAPRKVPALEA
jgi:multidrug efflux pump subunit AcrB